MATAYFCLCSDNEALIPAHGRLHSPPNRLLASSRPFRFHHNSTVHEFLLGGVFGLRPLLVPPVDFSFAFRIEKLHIRVSSTDIRAPELSNSPQ